MVKNSISAIRTAMQPEVCQSVLMSIKISVSIWKKTHQKQRHAKLD
jgi:hypothetical protein